MCLQAQDPYGGKKKILTPLSCPLTSTYMFYMCVYVCDRCNKTVKKKISKLNHQLGDLAYNKNVSKKKKGGERGTRGKGRGRGGERREREGKNRPNKDLKLGMLLSGRILAYHA